IPCTEISSICSPQKPEQNEYTDDHVQGMHAGHPEVEEEEYLRALRHVRRQGLLMDAMRGRVYEFRYVIVRARNVMVHPLDVPLLSFDTEEGDAEQHCEHEHPHQHLALAHLRGPDGQRHE